MKYPILTVFVGTNHLIKEQKSTSSHKVYRLISPVYFDVGNYVNVDRSTYVDAQLIVLTRVGADRIQTKQPTSLLVILVLHKWGHDIVAYYLLVEH